MVRSTGIGDTTRGVGVSTCLGVVAPAAIGGSAVGVTGSAVAAAVFVVVVVASAVVVPAVFVVVTSVAVLTPPSSAPVTGAAAVAPSVTTFVHVLAGVLNRWDVDD
ncbi:hypothetical protein BYT27DRAFT_7261529 [Phlegmacium glaucopus]|nr:hypothetical protein BYT27DRAFT_7261529 [Phlegmacium glaucopus]